MHKTTDIFFKLGETTRKIVRIKETDSVRFLGIWLDTKLNFNDYFKTPFFFLIQNHKIESLKKKALRLLMGLPNRSHTAEAFQALNIRPFRKLETVNVINFLFQSK